jgi:hypothetical protein
MHRNQLRVMGCVLLLLAATGVGRAAEVFDAAALAKQVEPFISDKTVVVAHASAERVDFDVLKANLTKWSNLAGEKTTDEQVKTLDQSLQSGKEGLAAITKLGVRGAFVVVNIGELPADPGFVVVQLAADADVDGIKKLIEERILSKVPKGPDAPTYAIEKLGSVLYAGSDKWLKRVKLHLDSPVPRPDVAAALEAAGDADVQWLLVPQSEPRALAAGLLPQLPPNLGGGPTTDVTEGLRWAAIGTSLVPAAKLKIVIQAKDAEAAKKLEGILDKVFAMAKQADAPASEAALRDDLLKKLTPQVNGDRLTATLDEEQLEGILKEAAAANASAPAPASK